MNGKAQSCLLCMETMTRRGHHHSRYPAPSPSAQKYHPMCRSRSQSLRDIHILSHIVPFSCVFRPCPKRAVSKGSYCAILALSRVFWEKVSHALWRMIEFAPYRSPPSTCCDQIDVQLSRHSPLYRCIHLSTPQNSPDQLKVKMFLWFGSITAFTVSIMFS